MGVQSLWDATQAILMNFKVVQSSGWVQYKTFEFTSREKRVNLETLFFLILIAKVIQIIGLTERVNVWEEVKGLYN